MNLKKYLVRHEAIKPFLLMVLTFLLISACNSSMIQSSNTSTGGTDTIDECRMIKHSLGKTCIPLKPQRIISNYPHLDTLFALGVKESVVGISCLSGVNQECFLAPGLSPNQIEGIETVGSYSPSLEKLLFLKPDLILYELSPKSMYQQLSNIAPTVPIYWEENRSSFKDHIRRIAEIVNRKEVAEKILIQYQNRIAKIKKQLGNRLKDKQVSTIIYGYTKGGFSRPTPYEIWFQILNDLGINIKPIFPETYSWVNFSIEVINNYDSDILFIFNTNKAGDFRLDNPIISSLNAVRNGRAYVINDRNEWDVYGPSGVNRLLDVLSEKLLEAAQTF